MYSSLHSSQYYAFSRRDHPGLWRLPLYVARWQHWPWYLPVFKGTLFSRHPHIRLFLRGATSKDPPIIHRFPTWRLNMVLSALTKPPFEIVQDIPLKWLRLKAIFLIAITTPLRVSELGAIPIWPDLCVFHKDRVILRPDPTFLPKVASKLHRAQGLILQSFCPNPFHPRERVWHSLDVRRLLKAFLIRTESFRQSESLFINIIPTNSCKAVSR